MSLQNYSCVHTQALTTFAEISLMGCSQDAETSWYWLELMLDQKPAHTHKIVPSFSFAICKLTIDRPIACVVGWIRLFFPITQYPPIYTCPSPQSWECYLIWQKGLFTCDYSSLDLLSQTNLDYQGDHYNHDNLYKGHTREVKTKTDADVILKAEIRLRYCEDEKATSQGMHDTCRRWKRQGTYFSFKIPES